MEDGVYYRMKNSRGSFRDINPARGLLWIEECSQTKEDFERQKTSRWIAKPSGDFHRQKASPRSLRDRGSPRGLRWIEELLRVFYRQKQLRSSYRGPRGLLSLRTLRSSHLRPETWGTSHRRPEGLLRSARGFLQVGDHLFNLFRLQSSQKSSGDRSLLQMEDLSKKTLLNRRTAFKCVLYIE